MNYLQIGLLFFLFSPGILINIPSIQNKLFFSIKTSLLSVFIHSILFSLFIYFYMNNIKEDFKERSRGVPLNNDCDVDSDCKTELNCCKGKCIAKDCD